MQSTFEIITQGEVDKYEKSDYKSEHDLYIEVYENTLKNMDRKDRIAINDIIRDDGKKMYFQQKQIRNLGRVAKLELLGALGIFLSQFPEAKLNKALAERQKNKKKYIDMEF